METLSRWLCCAATAVWKCFSTECPNHSSTGESLVFGSCVSVSFSSCQLSTLPLAALR